MQVTAEYTEVIEAGKSGRKINGVGVVCCVGDLWVRSFNCCEKSRIQRCNCWGMATVPYFASHIAYRMSKMSIFVGRE